MGRKLKFEEDKFIKSCCEIFTTKGYVGCSTRDIMKKTGVELASIYNKYKNKENLFLVCITNYVEREFKKDLQKILSNKKISSGNIMLTSIFESSNLKKNSVLEIRRLMMDARGICRDFSKEKNLNKSGDALFDEFISNRLFSKIDVKKMDSGKKVKIKGVKAIKTKKKTAVGKEPQISLF